MRYLLLQKERVENNQPIRIHGCNDPTHLSQLRLISSRIYRVKMKCCRFKKRGGGYAVQQAMHTFMLP